MLEFFGNDEKLDKAGIVRNTGDVIQVNMGVRMTQAMFYKTVV